MSFHEWLTNSKQAHVIKYRIELMPTYENVSKPQKARLTYYRRVVLITIANTTAYTQDEVKSMHTQNLFRSRIMILHNI